MTGATLPAGAVGGDWYDYIELPEGKWGFVLADVSGKGAVEAARMAVEAYGGKVAGVPIEIVSADHQNKADVASGTARKWFDVDKVDFIVDKGQGLKTDDLVRVEAEEED